jgi:hypothetical protein
MHGFIANVNGPHRFVAAAKPDAAWKRTVTLLPSFVCPTLLCFHSSAPIRLPYSSLLSFVCPYSSALLFSAFIRLALFIHRFYLAAVS